MGWKLLADTFFTALRERHDQQGEGDRRAGGGGESLRAELTKAVEAGKDQPMQFSVDPIELTAQVAVTKGADGKIGWNLLGLGGSWESASTQTLTLKLTPVWKKPDGTLERDFTSHRQARLVT